MRVEGDSNKTKLGSRYNILRESSTRVLLKGKYRSGNMYLESLLKRI